MNFQSACGSARRACLAVVRTIEQCLGRGGKKHLVHPPMNNECQRTLAIQDRAFWLPGTTQREAGGAKVIQKRNITLFHLIGRNRPGTRDLAETPASSSHSLESTASSLRSQENTANRRATPRINSVSVASGYQRQAVRKNSPGLRQQIWSLCALLIVLLSCNYCAAIAQTRESDPGPKNSDEQTPEGEARQTQGTVKNPYYNSRQALANMESASRINQAYVSGSGPRGVWGQFAAVDKILVGEQTNVVFQAAEQGKGMDVQRIARNSLNASLGSINSTYTGLHKWYADDLIGNLFTNIGQLIGRWLSELINGWISDSVQYLAQFLRIFVLNPNIAVNGLNGRTNDGISPYIRQGADTMYGIAVDLLLLLFILCIWRHWADASWKGAGNLMAPVGRLIFTAGILLAWPTICAFEIQITNEMIKAIYFNSNDQLAQLHLALATAVKGGLIAAGAGALSVFAPILGGAAAGSAGSMVSGGFYFASIVVFVILGGVLIAELVYLIVLKAIQTALLCAQYMFAPIFLVFFATPSTENIATGFIRACVETSLWTFVWVGLLKVMVIVIYSNFNPWGKILVAIGVLQLMIQVPAFLARAQISPMSDFISAGLISGGLMKAMSGLGSMLTSGVSTLVGKEIESKMLQGVLTATETQPGNLAQDVKNPDLVKSLNEASYDERARQHAQEALGNRGSLTPPTKTTPKDSVPSSKPPDMKPLTDASATKALDKPPPKSEVDAASALVADNAPLLEPLPTKPDDKAGPETMPVLPAKDTAPALNTEHRDSAAESPTGLGPTAKTPAPATTDTAETSTPHKPLDATAQAPGGHHPSPPPATKTKTPSQPSSPTSVWRWQSQGARSWDESNLINVPVRKIIGKLTSVDGVGVRGTATSGVIGSAEHGVQRINIAHDADDAEQMRVLYTAAYADMVAHDDPARDAARRSAFAAKAHQPQGFKESLIANWMEANGKSWYSTPWAKERFSRGVMSAAVTGAAAYVSGDQTTANAYTTYLQDRFGDWDADNKGTQEALAIHYITNPDSSESPFNRNIGPATESCINSGISLSPGARGAMQNMAIQGMHPARRKQAVYAMLAYCFPDIEERYGNPDKNPVFDLALGERCRALPAEEVNAALAMYQVSGLADLKPEYTSHVNAVAADTGRELPLCYSSLATAAPHVARQLGRVRASTNLDPVRTISDLNAVIVPSGGETKEEAINVVLATTGAALRAGELHGIPMRTIQDAGTAAAIYEFMGSDVVNINTPSAHRKMQVIAKNLSTPGTPNDAGTFTAIYSYGQAGGNIQQLDADHINIATRLVDSGVSGRVLPAAVEMAIQNGYHSSAAPLPVAELVNAAQHYASGQVSDYRYARIVSQMSGANMRNISNQTIRLAAEAIADTGGEFNEQHVAAVVRVSQGLRNGNFAPDVVETFVRAEGIRANIPSAADMPLGQLIGELDSSGRGMEKIADSIVSVQRMGGFADRQLQEPATVQLLVESQQNAGAHTMQAISVLARIIGADQVMSHPEYRAVAEEFLSNDGQARDLDFRPIQALRDLNVQRQHVQSQIQQMPNDDARAALQEKLGRFQLNKSTMTSITSDPSYKTGQGINSALWNKVFT